MQQIFWSLYSLLKGGDNQITNEKQMNNIASDSEKVQIIIKDFFICGEEVVLYINSRMMHVLNKRTIVPKQT